MKRILNFSFTKIIVGLIICAGLVVAAQIGIRALLKATPLADEVKNLIGGLIVAVISLISYSVLYSFYEKRKITELSKNHLVKNLALGILLGAVLQSLTIFVIYLTGGFSVISVNNFLYFLPALTMAFTSAIFEEILFRGIIFRLMEEKLGSYIALALSALLFGLMHWANPNSSLIAALGLSVQAGFLLGAAFIYSKNLWFPIAIHFAWNFTQSGIYGASTSGHNIGKSLLTTKIEGTELITGGQFGPEGSIQATLFCLTAAIILMILNHKQNKIVRPYWTNNAVIKVLR
jgi:membrane protease YdiL (CAAX protease family)